LLYSFFVGHCNSYYSCDPFWLKAFLSEFCLFIWNFNVIKRVHDALYVGLKCLYFTLISKLYTFYSTSHSRDAADIMY
jgi:hypothetical protein